MSVEIFIGYSVLAWCSGWLVGALVSTFKRFFNAF